MKLNLRESNCSWLGSGVSDEFMYITSPDFLKFLAWILAPPEEKNYCSASHRKCLTFNLLKKEKKKDKQKQIVHSVPGPPQLFIFI